MDPDDYEFLETTTATGLEGGTEKTLVNIVTTSIPFIPLGSAIIIVTVFGLLGNLLSAIVLSRKRLQSSYSVLTLGLTFVDSVYLLTKFLRYGIASLFTHYSVAQAYTNVGLPIIGPYIRAITFTAHTASTYFTIAIAIDRYIAVCWSASARKYCTRKVAGWISLVVLIWSFVFNVTRWFEFRSVEVRDDMSATTEVNNEDEISTPSKEWSGSVNYAMQITEFRKDPVYKEVYIFWIYLIFMFIIPFVTLSVLNLCIFFGIRRMVKNGASLSSTQRRDTSFSIMLIGVVLVFLICNVDYLVLDILEYSGLEYSEFWNYLGNFLLTLNSAANFLVYCLCGWKFRQELWKIIRDICPCLKQHGSHDIAGTDESQWVKDTMNNMDLQTIPRVTLSKASNKSQM